MKEIRIIEGKSITVHQQDFTTSTVKVEDSKGEHICPMGQDTDGNIYFLYGDWAVYFSNWLGYVPQSYVSVQ